MMAIDPQPLAADPVTDCSFTCCGGGGIKLDLFRDQPVAHVGDSVTYTVFIGNPKNNSTCDITGIAVTLITPDNVSHNLTPVPFDLPAGSPSVMLGPVTFTVPGALGDQLVATATATGTLGDCFCTNNGTTMARSQVCTFVARPALTATKQADRTLSKVGDTVTYSIQVCNTGNIALCRTQVVDNLLHDLTSSFPAVLQSGECSPVVTVARPVAQGDADPLVNVVTATYHDALGGANGTVTSQATATVNLFQPSVTVQKSGPQFSKVNDTVTYSFTITNTSSADSPNLILDSVSDTLLGDLTSTAFVSCGNLAPGATCSFTATHPVTGAESTLVGNMLNNTVTVNYHPDGFPNNITASDSHSVQILHPRFSVTKTCTTQPVSSTGTAVFKVTVTNTGDVTLNFTTDESAPFSLAPGASNSFNVSKPVPSGATSVPNTVNVTATLPPSFGLGNVLTGSATDSCRVACLGKTPGFWRNQNGHTIIDGNLPVSIGLPNLRHFTVNTIAQSDTILGNSYCSLCTGNPNPCGAPCSSRPAGVNQNSLEVLAAHTLALTYNINLISCFSGQTIGSLGCTSSIPTVSLTPPVSSPPAPLTASSTVNDVLAVANQLFGNLVSGGQVTQTQVGQMNTLLSCINRENV